ncbi:hypothetical protein RHMOL_Rhmol04G0215200 [Rhododendron molle]|uniref:Uncharacterized protein n=1 Tax=Rhododendron molle TaxID=49168 RepID=A0ACC0P3A0_RHOML|nr:hypothetical protein RHMOL_Rhmol04G0215200 [Rhododendron molle]
MADHGGSGGDGDVVDQPEDRGGPMEIQTVDRQTAEGTEEGPGTVAEGPPIVGGSSGDGGSSGAVGDVPGSNGSPPRDPARGKGVVAEEEETTEILVEYREQDVAFRPAETSATSSRHVPVTKQDIAEHLPDDRLARLLEANPEIGEIVLKAKEERAWAIAAWEAAEKVERERERERERIERSLCEKWRPRRGPQRRHRGLG